MGDGRNLCWLSKAKHGEVEREIKRLRCGIQVKFTATISRAEKSF
jgi:hypothetical protein